MSNKDIIFYSNYCVFSREVVDSIIKRDLKNNFVFICVDTNRHRIPQQIDRVPALYLRQTGDVIFEDDIITYIEKHITEDISPIDNSTYSDCFSFLDDNQSQMGFKQFGVFGQEQQIYTPDDDTSQNKADSSNSLENYANQREMDTKRLFSSRP